MVDETYRIVLKGEILPGRDMAEVKESIARTFKLKTDHVEKLFAGKSVSVKRGLNLETATKFKNAFERAGAKVYIVSESGNAAAAAGETKPAPAAAPKPEKEDTQRRNKPAPMTCPKCGHVQPMAEECVNCGVVISKLEKTNKAAEVAPQQKQESKDGVVLFVDKGMGREERLLNEGIKLWDKPSETMKKLEAQLNKPDRWRSHLKLAGMLIIGNKPEELRRAQEILEIVNKNTNDGRPETFDLLVTKQKLAGNKKELREAALRAIKLYQLDYPNQETKKDRKVYTKNVERLRKEAGLERTFAVVDESGGVVFETTDMRELRRMRRDKKLPEDSRVIENGLGDGVPLKMWRRPHILGISFDDRPVTSLAKLIAIIPGIIGIFLMWDQCMELFDATINESATSDPKFLAFLAVIPVVLLIFRKWKWALYVVAFILFFVVGPGFIVGAAIGFLPSLLIAWLVWPIYKKRLEPEEAKPKQVATT